MNISVEELGESVVGWAQLGNLKLVKAWSERANLDLDFQSDTGITALIAAIENGHYELAEYLLRSGANPNRADLDGVAPLHYAILHVEDFAYDAARFINLLIEAKADVNAQTNNGKTPLHLACQLHEIGLCRILILAEADCFVKDTRGFFPHSIEVTGEEFHRQFLEKFRAIIGRRILDLKKQFNYTIQASIDSGLFSEDEFSLLLQQEPSPSPVSIALIGSAPHQPVDMRLQPALNLPAQQQPHVTEASSFSAASMRMHISPANLGFAGLASPSPDRMNISPYKVSASAAAHGAANLARTASMNHMMMQAQTQNRTQQQQQQSQPSLQQHGTKQTISQSTQQTTTTTTTSAGGVRQKTHSFSQLLQQNVSPMKQQQSANNSKQYLSANLQRTNELLGSGTVREGTPERDGTSLNQTRISVEEPTSCSQSHSEASEVSEVEETANLTNSHRGKARKIVELSGSNNHLPSTSVTSLSNSGSTRTVMSRQVATRNGSFSEIIIEESEGDQDGLHDDDAMEVIEVIQQTHAQTVTELSNSKDSSSNADPMARPKKQSASSKTGSFAKGITNKLRLFGTASTAFSSSSAPSSLYHANKTQSKRDQLTSSHNEEEVSSLSHSLSSNSTHSEQSTESDESQVHLTHALNNGPTTTHKRSLADSDSISARNEPARSFKQPKLLTPQPSKDQQQSQVRIEIVGDDSTPQSVASTDSHVPAPTANTSSNNTSNISSGSGPTTTTAVEEQRVLQVRQKNMQLLQSPLKNKVTNTTQNANANPLASIPTPKDRMPPMQFQSSANTGNNNNSRGAATEARKESIESTTSAKRSLSVPLQQQEDEMVTEEDTLQQHLEAASNNSGSTNNSRNQGTRSPILHSPGSQSPANSPKRSAPDGSQQQQRGTPPRAKQEVRQPFGDTDSLVENVREPQRSSVVNLTNSPKRSQGGQVPTIARTMTTATNPSPFKRRIVASKTTLDLK